MATGKPKGRLATNKPSLGHQSIGTTVSVMNILLVIVLGHGFIIQASTAACTVAWSGSRGAFTDTG